LCLITKTNKMTIYEHILRLNRDVKDLRKSVCCLQNEEPEPPAALRFGVATEDDTAAENRYFNHAGFNFEFGDPSNAYFGLYLDGAYELYAEVRNTDFVATGYASFDMNASVGDGLCYISLYVEGTNAATDSVELTLAPNEFGIFLAPASNFLINSVPQDDTCTQILALDASNYVRWVDKSTLGGAGNLQSVTDAGNTTTNILQTETPAQYSLSLVTADGDAGLGFTSEPGGWTSIYLGSLLTFVTPGTSDKGNIYMGLGPAQGQVPGGDFNMFFGYQSGAAHPGTSKKFYLAQGISDHLMYGEFDTGNVFFRKLKVGAMYDGFTGTPPTAPDARLELVAGTATAGTGPLKFNAGTNLTVPVDGVMEFDGTNLYFTTGGVRKTVTLV
jgi:hypothetical protein